MHSLRTVLILAAAIAAARGAPAALQFTEVSRSGSNDAPRTFEVVTDGDRFSAKSPDEHGLLDAPGSYVLGTGGGKIYIVFPAMRAYALFDRERIAEMAGRARTSFPRARQKASADDMSSALENFKFEKVLDEAGPSMFGHPTRHYRYLLSYREVLHYAKNAKPMTTTVEETSEFWAAKDLGDIPTLMRRLGLQRGNAGPEEKSDKIAQAKLTMASHGFMLKSIYTRKSTDSGMPGMMGALARLSRHGSTSSSTTTDEVTALSQVRPARGAFELPRGFQETDMMSLFAAAAGRTSDLNGASRGSSKLSTAMPDLNSTGE